MIDRSVKIERRSFFSRIFIAYKNYSLSFCQQRDICVGERDLLFLVFTGTLILFMANLPVQLVRGSILLGVDVRTYVGLIGFVSLFFVPLLLYFLAGSLFLILKVVGGSSTFYELRLAVFWSLNVAGPLIVLNGFLKGVFFGSEGIEYVSIVLQSYIAWIISSIIMEAEKFKSKLPMFFILISFVIMPLFSELIVI